MSMCLIANYHNVYFVFIIETILTEIPLFLFICFGPDPVYKVFVRISSLIQKTYIIPTCHNCKM